MMPRGKVRRILRNAAWGAFAQHFGEPWPSDQALQERPGLQDAQIVAYFLHVRARKPGGITG